MNLALLPDDDRANGPPVHAGHEQRRLAWSVTSSC
jgi:hypothetical protein